jgi:hypothetical protein
MGVTRHIVDGNQTLAEQERALNLMEQTTCSKVISYTKTIMSAEPGMNSNEALLEDVPIGEQRGNLSLQVIEPTADFTQSIQKGRLVVFHDFAYVASVLQMVFGSRR